MFFIKFHRITSTVFYGIVIWRHACVMCVSVCVAYSKMKKVYYIWVCLISNRSPLFKIKLNIELCTVFSHEVDTFTVPKLQSELKNLKIYDFGSHLSMKKWKYSKMGGFSIRKVENNEIMVGYLNKATDPCIIGQIWWEKKMNKIWPPKHICIVPP